MSVFTELAPARAGSGCAAGGLPAAGGGWAKAGAALKNANAPVLSERSETDRDARTPARILVILERILSQFNCIEGV
jgi:hypothetical protein